MDLLAKLDHFYLPGALTIWCAVIFAVCSMWGYAEVMLGRKDVLPFARRGYTFFSLSIVLSAAVLLLCLYRRDFRIEYVYQYSGLDLPLHYQLSAFWAGQKGSFLIWLLWGVLLGLPLRRAAGRDEAPVMGVYMLTLVGLLFILARENPFVMLPEAPADGAGLNPLLQDSWMVIHPPVMFIGYAATAIPFAFAVAAMWRRDTSSWAARAFPWALGGFLVLGAAILMGGYWAYRTLGWGGYWGWDPVENASLIPWLVGVVLIHGLYLEKTRGRFRRLNLVLACVLYMTVLYGTFLTRSGVLADFSVHSFVDLGISGWLIAVMAFFGLSSLYLLITRLGRVETQPNDDPFLSRGSWMMLATIVVGLSALVITFGTSAPLITSWVMEQPGQVGPEFYNTVNMPLALLIAALLATVPFLTWKELEARELMRKVVPSAAVALVATMVGLTVGVTEVFHLVFLFLASWALAANLQKVGSLLRSQGLRAAGGYLAHAGVGVMLIGILASSAYDQSVKVTLPQGQAVQVDPQTRMTFVRFLERDGSTRERMEVQVEKSGGKNFALYPKLFVNDRTKQLMVNPDIRKSFLEDLYVSPIEFQPAEDPSRIQTVDLAKGDTARFGDISLQFVDFDLGRHEDPMVQLARGGQVEIKALLAATRNGERQDLAVAYRFSGSGAVETPPTALPGQGRVTLAAIDPKSGRIRVEVAGAAATALPARLSVDVTRKPLIFLVWAGLYVILAGGLIAVVERWRQARKVDEVHDKIAAAQAAKAGEPPQDEPLADANLVTAGG